MEQLFVIQKHTYTYTIMHKIRPIKDELKDLKGACWDSSENFIEKEQNL